MPKGATEAPPLPAFQTHQGEVKSLGHSVSLLSSPRPALSLPGYFPPLLLSEFTTIHKDLDRKASTIQGGLWCCSLPGSRTRGQMDPNIPPTAVGTYLTLCGSWEGLPVQASHWRGGSVGHQGLIQPTRFDQLNCFNPQRTVAFVGLYGECQACHSAKPSRNQQA